MNYSDGSFTHLLCRVLGGSFQIKRLILSLWERFLSDFLNSFSFLFFTHSSYEVDPPELLIYASLFPFKTYFIILSDDIFPGICFQLT